MLSHVAKTESTKEGEKEVQRKKGDGVRARLISSRQGELGLWETHGSEMVTKIGTVKVASGETLDFIVDGCQNDSDDGFDWPVLIHVVDSSGRRADTARWNSRVDFRGPQADVWQQFAQALLMTNEFIFVD